MQAEMSRLRVVEPDALPSPEPDGSEAIGDDAPSPGGYIREQRQRRGLSVEQLAVATKIPASSLRRLEADEFGDLPGPVFVKGFLRCCTRALGLPSETVMELLYERERATLLARRTQLRSGARPTARTGSRPAARTGSRPATPATGSPETKISPSRPATRTPPRMKERPAPNGGVVRRALLGGLPGTNALLWLIVAAFVAILVMAAFNLANGSPLGPHT